MSEVRIRRTARGASIRERMKIRRERRLALYGKASPSTRRLERAAGEIDSRRAIAATARLKPGMFAWLTTSDPWPSDQPELAGRP